MQQSFFDPGDVMLHRFAVGHRLEAGEALVQGPWPISRALYSAGGMVSSVIDLLGYARMILAGGKTKEDRRIIKASAIDGMLRPQVTIWGQKEGIGLSWFANEVDGLWLVEHSGGTVGQGALLLMAPERGFALAILTNADSGEQVINAVREWVLKEILNLEITEPEIMDVPLEVLQECEGRYLQKPYGYTDIGVLGGRLVGQTIFTAGFPTEDPPPRPPPPPHTLAFYDDDRLIVLDGLSKGARGDILRTPGGTIKWLRMSGRLHVKTTLPHGRISI
jgi:hypothetical protein